MTYRDLYIGRWHVTFIFAPGGYDEEAVLTTVYDLDAPDDILVRIARKMRRNRPNEGFTYSNDALREAVVVIGPTTGGAEFIDTLVHEIQHVAANIADGLGLDLKGESPAYLAGDSARELVDVICRLGCPTCGQTG